MSGMSTRMPRVKTPGPIRSMPSALQPFWSRSWMAVEDDVLTVLHETVVAQRVEVRIGPVVDSEVDYVESEARRVRLRIHAEHLVFCGAEVEIIGGFFQAREVGKRDGDAVLYQAGRLHLLLRRDQIQRATFIVLSPAPPIGQLGFPEHHLIDGDDGMAGRSAGSGLGLSEEEHGSKHSNRDDVQHRPHESPPPRSLYFCGGELRHGLACTHCGGFFRTDDGLHSGGD